MIDIKKIINLILPIIVIVFAIIGLVLPVLERKYTEFNGREILGANVYLNKVCDVGRYGDQKCVTYNELNLNEDGKIAQAVYALTILIIIISGFIFILQLVGKTQTLSYLNILVLLLAISNLGLFANLTNNATIEKLNMAVGGIMLIIAFSIIIISNFALNPTIHKLFSMLK